MQIVIQVITSFLNFCTWLGEGAIRLVLWLVQQIQWLGQRFWRMTDSHIHPFYFRKYQSGHQSPHRHLKTTTHKKNPSYPLSKFPALRKVDAWMARSTYLSGYRSTRRLIYLVALMLLIVLTPLFWWRVGHQPEQVQAGWWDETWRYRQTVSITNGSGSVLTNFQVSFIIDTATLIADGKMNPDCSDVRITDISGNVLPYWIDDVSPGCNNASTRIWTKYPSISNAGSVAYVYYGNTSASSLSNGSAVFEFFQDFAGTTIADDIATGGGTVTQNEFVTLVNNADAWDTYIQNSSLTGRGYVFEAHVKADTNSRSFSGWYDSGAGISYTDMVYSIYFNAGTFNVREDGTSRVSPAVYTQGNWYDIRIDVKPAAGATFYYKASGGESWTQLYDSVYSSESNLHLGHVHLDATEQSHIDNWIIRKYAVSDPTTAVNTEEQSPAPVGYWKFDEGHGMVAQNSVANGLDFVTNYATNPSFETSATTTWSIYQSPTTAQSTDAVFGSYSHSMTTGASSNPYIYKTDAPVTLSTGQQWAFSAWVKAGNPSAVGKTITLNLRENGDNGYLSTTTTTLTAEWKQIQVSRTLTHVAPTALNRWIRITSTAGSGDVLLIDGVQLEQTSEPSPYCDGSLSGLGTFSWNGTPHASTSTCEVYEGGQLNFPTWESEDMCVSGKCLQFDGVDDQVAVSDQDAFDLNELTLSAWIRRTGASGDSVETIINKNKNYILRLTSTGYLVGYYWPESGTNRYNYTSTQSIADNKWQYVTLTIPDDPSQAFFTVDGEIVNISYTNTSEARTPTNPVTIGGVASANENFKGFIDEPKIYPYARTLAQIKADYSAGKAAMGTSQGNQASLGANPAESGINLANGLVGYWKMDESATPSLDSSGNNLSGTWTNTPTASTGKFGNATSFTGTANIALGNQSIVDNLANFTIAAWVYPSAQTAGTHFRVFSEESVLYVGQYGSQVSLYMGNGTAWTQSDVTGGALALNQWNHVIWTKNGTSASVYINGVLSKSNMPASASLGTSANTNHISTSNGSTQPWNGKLDEVRIYNRALSPAEVNALYNWAPGPKLYYNLDEASGSTVNDTSGNGYTGTVLSNTATVVGKFGNAKESAVAGTGVTFSGFSSGTEWSMMAWSHFPLDSNSGSWRTLFANNGGSYHHIIVSNTSGAGEIGTYNAGWYSSGYNIGSLTGWHHVAAIATGGTTKFYIDGVFVGTSSSVVNYNVSIVGNYVAGGDQTWGKFDDVKIYNYARTPAQIIEDMNAGHPAPGSPVGSALAHYKFDEGYGTTTSNWGNGGTTLNASITGATWTNNGKFGKALDFNGASSYVSFATQPINWSARNRTISAWVKPEAGDLTGEHDIVTGYSSSTEYSRMRLRYSAGKIYYVMMVYPGPTYATLTSTTSLVAGNWYHIVLTWDDANYYLYINGALEATVASASVTTDSISITTIGANIDSGDPATYTNGLIDEVKFYTTGLTADQIRAEYNQGKSEVLSAVSTESDGSTPSFSASREYCVPGDTATCNPPVAEWKFDENTGTTANDTSGNNNTGSFNGDPIWTVGKNGSALSFDGIDDYVSGNSNLGISGNAAFTMCSWIKWTGASWTANYPSFMGNNSTGATGQGLSFTVNGGRPAIDFWSARWRATNALATNTWYFICGTKVPGAISTTSKIYVNGIEVPGAVESDLTPNITNSPPIIGRLDDTRWFQGIIDNSRFYNYARTPAQIAWEYNQGAPVAWYKFDECQGTTINNSSLDGNGDAAGNDGTLTIGGSGTNTTPGTCATTGAWADGASGKFNSAMDFDGVDDYTTLGSDITVPKNDSSISWWMKRSVSQYETLFSRLPNASNCMIEVTSTNGIRIESYTNNVWTAVLPTGINTSDGQWHHYTVVFGAANTRLFVDGKLASTGSANTDTANFVVRYFGYKGTTGYGTWLTGQLDDVRIYNYALTADQVQTVYSDGAVSFR